MRYLGAVGGFSLAEERVKEKGIGEHSVQYDHQLPSRLERDWTQKNKYGGAT